jgi:hypothetical protein
MKWGMGQPSNSLISRWGHSLRIKLAVATVLPLILVSAFIPAYIPAKVE